MPSKYGSISKAFVVSDGTLDINDVQELLGDKTGTTEKNNPFAINLYVLGYNSNKNLTSINTEVLLACIDALKDKFDIDNMQFNDVINISEIELILANIEGVASVPKVEIVNKCGGEYSPQSYNIVEATKNKIIYPSLDPSIFEIKFPDKDIRGRAL